MTTDSIKLGTSTCPSSIQLNSNVLLTASTTQGTPPFSYLWTITKPDTTTDIFTDESYTYTFTQLGTYNVNLTVYDNCSLGSLSDSSSCNVTISELQTIGFTFMTSVITIVGIYTLIKLLSKNK